MNKFREICYFIVSLHSLNFPLGLYANYTHISSSGVRNVHPYYNFMFQSRLWNIYRCSGGGGNPCCYGTLKFITVSTKVR